MVWGKISSVTGAGSGTNLTTGTITASKFNEFNIYTTAFVSGKLRFNNDTGTNYARRYSANGGSDSTANSEKNIGYIRLKSFNENSDNQFLKSIKKFEKNPKIIYENNGQYNVSLTVLDYNGFPITESKENIIILSDDFIYGDLNFDINLDTII